MAHVRRWVSLLMTPVFGVVLFFSVLQSAQAADETFYLFIFNQPVAGQEDAYNDWYNKQHMRDVVAVPGFVSAQRFVLADTQMRVVPSKPRYLVLYKIVTSDLPSVYAEVNRRIKSGETKISKALDLSLGESFTYQVFRPEVKGSRQDLPGATGDKQPYIHVVFGDAMPGQDETFNYWYDTYHVHEMADAPGFTGGQRMILSDVQMGPNKEQRHRYMVVFTMLTADLKGVFTNRSVWQNLTNSDAFDRNRAFGYTFKPITPVVMGDDVRRQRGAP